MTQTAAPASEPRLATRVAGPLKVALYSGIYVRHDAVSNSLHLKLEALRRLVEMGLKNKDGRYLSSSRSPVAGHELDRQVTKLG